MEIITISICREVHLALMEKRVVSERVAEQKIKELEKAGYKNTTSVKDLYIMVKQW